MTTKKNSLSNTLLTLSHLTGGILMMTVALFIIFQLPSKDKMITIGLGFLSALLLLTPLESPLEDEKHSVSKSPLLVPENEELFKKDAPSHHDTGQPD